MRPLRQAVVASFVLLVAAARVSATGSRRILVSRRRAA